MTTVRNLTQGVRAMTSNAFLVTPEAVEDPSAGRSVLVDPGANFDVVERVRSVLGDDATSTSPGVLDAVVLTHTHSDHVGNVEDVVAAFDVDVWGFDPDHELVDHGIADGETVRMGDDAFLALHTPGHIPDHLCLYAREPGILFAGDLVFANGGFGRTDLPGGDRETLIASIDAVREAVEEDLTAIYVGHGPAIETNPLDQLELAGRAARIG